VGCRAFSIIRKFEDKIHPVPLKERIEHASFKLRAQLDKLEHMYSRLQQRDRDLFQRCVGAQVSKDIGHAKIYANECAEIRKIAKVVLGSQLALEKVILRLETVEEFGNIMMQMAPVMSIVNETKSKIAGVVPQVASELDAVNSLLGDLTDEAGEVTESSMPIETTDMEAKKVLEETGVVAEQRLRDQFPDLPSLEYANHPRIAEPAVAGAGASDSLQAGVYEYARKHEGELNIRTCADSLGASPEDVRNALERLRDAGKVVFE
jgi:division protein CdvB (Snf7/Vps24/ESCRT-III family)